MFARSKITAVVSSSRRGLQLTRRAALAVLSGAAAGFLCGRARAENSGVTGHAALDLEVPGFREGFSKVRVLVPDGALARSRTLVLLHGLGETRDPKLALRAWPTLYGVTEANSRLLARPFVPPGAGKPKYWTEAMLSSFDGELDSRPYIGAVVVCPRTPNPSVFADRDRLFEDYATWICDAVLPAVERQVAGATRHVGLDGCSLGGYVAMEVLVRRAQVFASAGCVQGALGEHRLGRYAEQLTRIHRSRPDVRLRIASSLADPYLGVSKQLSNRLTTAGVAHELDVVPGPHNQPWLCEIGTPRMLRWHDLAMPRGAQ